MGSRNIESMLVDSLDFAAITSMVAAELDIEDARAQSEYAFARGLDVDDVDFSRRVPLGRLLRWQAGNQDRGNREPR